VPSADAVPEGGGGGGGVTVPLGSVWPTFVQPAPSRPWPHLLFPTSDERVIRSTRYYATRFFGNRIAFNAGVTPPTTPGVVVTTRFGAFVSFDVGVHWMRVDTKAIAHHFVGDGRKVLEWSDRVLAMERGEIEGACGVTTGLGAVINTAKVEAGTRCVVFGLGGIGLNVIQGLRLVGAEMIVGVDLNPERKKWGERFGMTHFVNPREAGNDLVKYLVDLTKGGADYTFECVGNVDLMRTALECCHKGWGESIIIGVAPAGAEIKTRPFQLVTGRAWRGTAFGGARGRTDVPRIVDWYMEKKIEIDPMITHTMPLSDINRAFDLMHEGKSIRSVVLF